MEQVLRNVFGDCKHLMTSVCKNKSSFEIINDAIFFISDRRESQPVEVVNSTEYELTVKNQSKEYVCLVKTDKCLFTDTYSKCDCILFNDIKFFLVEIKNSNAGKRNSKRNRAVEQLSATMELLIQNNISIRKFDARAVICFKRNDRHPVRASMNSQRAVFLEKYGISLEEGNLIEF